MAELDGGGSEDDDGGLTIDAFSITWGGTQTTSSSSSSNWWKTSPRAFIRGVIFRPLVRAVLAIASLFVSAILTVGRGSQSGFSMEEEVWGIADLPLALMSWVLDVVIWTIRSYFDVLIAVNTALTPTIPGPFDGVIITVALLVEVYLTAEILKRLIPAIVDAIPVVSGIGKFLWG